MGTLWFTEALAPYGRRMRAQRYGREFAVELARLHVSARLQVIAEDRIPGTGLTGCAA